MIFNGEVLDITENKIWDCHEINRVSKDINYSQRLFWFGASAIKKMVDAMLYKNNEE